MTDDERDDLASAYLDGATTAEETARVEADPALLARVAELRHVRDLVAEPVEPPSVAARDAAITAALAAATDANRAEEEEPAGPAAVRPLPRRSHDGRWLRVVAAAAAVLAVVALLPLLASLGDDSSDDTLAATAAPEAAEAPDAGTDEATAEESSDDGGEGETHAPAPTTTTESPALSQETEDVASPAEDGPAADDGDFAPPDELATTGGTPPLAFYDLGTASEPSVLARRVQRELRDDAAAYNVVRPQRTARRCLRNERVESGDDLKFTGRAVLDDEDVLVLAIETQVRIARAVAGADGAACSDIARVDLPDG